MFVHGGFLNFGSTSGQSYNQQFFPTEQYDTVRVLLGYRVSILGFLSSQRCGLDGNYGFKDVWVGLEWVKENISAFGGMYRFFSSLTCPRPSTVLVLTPQVILTIYTSKGSVEALISFIRFFIMQQDKPVGG